MCTMYKYTIGFITGLLAVILLAVLPAGNDVDLEHLRYCDMVSQGHWPDFKGEYKYCEVVDNAKLSN